MPGVMLLWSVIRDSELICEAPPEPSKKLLTNFVADVSNSPAQLGRGLELSRVSQS